MKKKIAVFLIGAMLAGATLTGTQAQAKQVKAYTIGVQDSDIYLGSGKIVKAVHNNTWTGYMVIKSSWGTKYRAEIDPEDLEVGDPVIFAIYKTGTRSTRAAKETVIRVNIDASRH